MSVDPRCFLFTSTSGVGVRKSLALLQRAVEQASQLPQGQGPVVLYLEDYLNAGDHVRRVSPQSPEPDAFTSALMLPKPLLRRLWAEAAQRVVCEADTARERGRDVFVHLHACWYQHRNRELTSFVDPFGLLDAGASPVVTLIDDVFDVRARLLDDGRLLMDDLGADATVSDRVTQAARQIRFCLRWRHMDIVVTELVASALAGGAHYLFAVKHPVETLRRLLYRPDLHTVYLSHPISGPRRLLSSAEEACRKEGEHCVNEICEVANLLRWDPSLVVFEPAGIDELRFLTSSIDKREYPIPVLSERWPIPPATEGELVWVSPDAELEYDGRFAFDEDLSDLATEREPGAGASTEDEAMDRALLFGVQVVFDDMEEQINSRDHQLVDQSDSLAVYRPLFRGVASQGVNEEVVYFAHLVEDEAAADSGKLAIIYSPIEDEARYCAERIRVQMMDWRAEGALSERNGESIENIEIEELLSLAAQLGPLGEAERGGRFDEWARERGMSLRMPPRARKRSQHALGPDGAATRQQWLGSDVASALTGCLDEPYFVLLAQRLPKAFVVERGPLTVVEFADMVRKYVGKGSIAPRV